MTVKDFVKLNNDGSMFELVDASKVGYIAHPDVLTCADRNVVAKEYGEKEVIGFAIKSRIILTLYIK